MRHCFRLIKLKKEIKSFLFDIYNAFVQKIKNKKMSELGFEDANTHHGE